MHGVVAKRKVSVVESIEHPIANQANRKASLFSFCCADGAQCMVVPRSVQVIIITGEWN